MHSSPSSPLPSSPPPLLHLSRASSFPSLVLLLLLFSLSSFPLPSAADDCALVESDAVLSGELTGVNIRGLQVSPDVTNYYAFQADPDELRRRMHTRRHPHHRRKVNHTKAPSPSLPSPPSITSHSVSPPSQSYPTHLSFLPFPLFFSDADLYAVLLTDDPTASPFPCQTPDNATYWSETPGGDALVIRDLSAAQWVLLYVTAGSDATATYDLVADVSSPSRTARSTLQLPLGESLYGAISAVESDVWSYYEVHVPNAGNVTLTLRRMQGAATLYASVGALPTRSVYEVTNAGGVDDFVVVQAVQEDVNVYVGVYAATLSTYLLWASFTPIPGETTAPPTTAQWQRLVAGIPFPGRLTGAEGEAVYFYFPSTSDFQQPITIYLDVTSLDGEADMYVSTVGLGIEGAQFPSSSAFWWQAVNYQDDVLTIPTSDPHFCTQPCNYTVAVVPWQGRGATFTLTATKTTHHRPVRWRADEGSGAARLCALLRLRAPHVHLLRHLQRQSDQRQCGAVCGHQPTAQRRPRSLQRQSDGAR